MTDNSLLRATVKRPNNALRREHGYEAVALHNKNARLTISVGERFNFPIKAFSTLAVTSVPDDGPRHSIVCLATQFHYTVVSWEFNRFIPFSHRFQMHTCSSPQGRASSPEARSRSVVADKDRGCISVLARTKACVPMAAPGVVYCDGLNNPWRVPAAQ